MIFSSNCFSPENWESNKFDICLRHSVLDGTGDMQGWAIWTQSRCLVGVKGQALHYIVIAHFWSPLFSWRAGMKHFFLHFYAPSCNQFYFDPFNHVLTQKGGFLFAAVNHYLFNILRRRPTNWKKRNLQSFTPITLRERYLWHLWTNLFLFLRRTIWRLPTVQRQSRCLDWTFKNVQPLGYWKAHDFKLFFEENFRKAIPTLC